MNQQITCRRSTPSTMEAIWVFRAVSFGTFDAQRVSTFGQKRRVAMIQHGKRTTERSSSPVSPTELDRDMTPFSPPLLRRRPVKTGRLREQQEIIPRIAQKSRGKCQIFRKKAIPAAHLPIVEPLAPAIVGAQTEDNRSACPVPPNAPAYNERSEVRPIDSRKDSRAT